MVVPKPATRGARLLLSLLIVIGAVVSVSVATQVPALAGTCPVPSKPAYKALGSELTAEPTYYFTISTTTGCSSTDIPYSHRCMALYTGNGVQSVQCSDVYIKVPEIGYVEMWAVGSYYCQGGGLFPCYKMSVGSMFAYKGIWGNTSYGTYTSTTTGYSCLAVDKPCPAGKAEVGSGHVKSQYTPTGLGTWCIEAWGVDKAVSEVEPYSTTVTGYDDSNFSSNHVNLCFS